MNDLLKQTQLISSINYANWGIGLALLIIFTLIFQFLFRNFALVATAKTMERTRVLFPLITCGKKLFTKIH